jgi:hypothetical protein
MTLIAVISHDNYYNKFYRSSCEMVELQGDLFHSATCFLDINQHNYPDKL